MVRVVIADDMHISRNILKRIVVHDLHFDLVGEAKNGREAVELCERHRPDIVMLDLSMPVLTGMQAAEIVHRDQTARQIVVVSSQAQHVLTDRLKELDAIFVMKPYSPKQLVGALAKFTDGEPR